MRRGNPPRGRGGARPLQHSYQNSRQPENSLFLTNQIQLQGLKDIDMELELLKRKREIIEQQQHILTSSYRPRNDYQQPDMSQSRDNRYDDYASLYDDHTSDLYGGGSSSRKRHAVPVWENESPKRFCGPSSAKRSFSSRAGPHVNNPRPNNPRPNNPRSNNPRSNNPRPNNPRSDFARPIGPRASDPRLSKPRPAPPPKRKEFNPTKVTKPSAAGQPATTLASYPPAERKKLVTASVANSSVKKRTVPPTGDDWILRADREPSRQLNGRLELALGYIIKQMKRANPDSEILFMQPASLRFIKKAVRERIWTAMVGKPCGDLEEIKAIYYETYNAESANDIIMKYLEMQKGGDFITVKSGDSEQFFKKNMSRLMSSKLEEMIHKLEEIYTNKVDTPYKKKKYHKQFNATLEPSKTEVEQPETDITQAEEPKPVEEQTVQLPVDDQTVQTPVEEQTEQKPEEEQTVQKPVEEQSKTEETAVSTQQTEVPQADVTQAEVVKTKPTIIDDADVQIVETPSTENISETPKNDTQMPDLISTEKYKQFDKLMTYKMMHLLKKFSPMMLRVMDIDSMYRKAKASILNETKRKLLGTSETGQSDQHQKQQPTPKKTPNEKKFLTPLYYVKILGKPGLPKRKDMNTFFEQFKPKSIKKHKMVHNLLFVGFSDKEEFNKILAADGTVIGRFTLDIKISERSDKKKQNGDKSANNLDIDKSSHSNSSSEIIGADLDAQISDLLSSIRKTESDCKSDDVVITDADGNNVQVDETADNSNLNETGSDDVVEIKDDQENKIVEVKDSEDDHEVVDVNDIPQSEAGAGIENGTTIGDNADAETNIAGGNNEGENVETNEENKDVVEPLVKGTPSRPSARLNTPSGIRTRRMSKLIE